MTGTLRRAVFLDRDGVLNRAIVREGTPRPPTSVDEVEILPGVQEAVGKLREAGYLLIVVTNQPDVARGVIARATVETINAMLQQAVEVDAVLTCYDDGDSPRRKPNPGMLHEAAEEYRIDLRRSFMVGDRWKDVEAGRRAGCRTILIDYGYEETGGRANPDAVAKNLYAAAEWILKEKLVVSQKEDNGCLQ